MTGILDQVFASAGPEVIFENFGDETVIANLETGLFYTVDGSGADIWNALVAGHTGQQFAAASGGDPVDIARYITELQCEGLLVAVSFAANAEPVAAAAYASPTLQKFDDLQGLLLVDPIHEASPAGWPFVDSSDEPHR